MRSTIDFIQTSPLMRGFALSLMILGHSATTMAQEAPEPGPAFAPDPDDPPVESRPSSDEPEDAAEGQDEAKDEDHGKGSTDDVKPQKTLLPGQPLINKPGHWLKVKGAVELGFLGVLYHRIKFSRTGSYFDYVEEGNQDNLFLFWRVSAELEIVNHHSLIFLYQPLDITTQALMSRDVVVDDLTFAEGTATNLRYGFDFYRFSYLYDFFDDPGTELAVGLSLQIRNATIVFTSVDGTLRRARNNIGPVPILKIRGRYTFDPGVWIGAEVDGFIASGKIITGSRKDFLGAILDASIRVGFDLTPYLETFVNLRYIGGGARGTSKEKDEPGDGYTKNWISLISFSIGVGFK